ncbi:MAG TPA: VCBS repeat-containing protein, partial [Polyangiales bacterium]
QEGGLSHLMLSSWDAPSDSGLLTLMYGTPDRIPFAPHTLVSFVVDGDVGGSSAVAVLPGRFVENESGENDGDVLAIGTRGNGAYTYWLVEDITSHSTIPRPLQQPLPDGFPAAIESSAGTLRPNVARASADFDRDGLDEALWLIPSADYDDCGLFLYDVDADGLTPRSTFRLGRPCLDAQLATVDLDGDEWIDITLLTGGADAAERMIHALWNDGSGHFSLEDQQPVALGEGIEALAVVPKTARREATVVVIRRREAQLVSLRPGERTFLAPLRLTGLDQGRGAAAGDFNGDGVPDVAVVDADAISVFSASLRGR